MGPKGPDRKAALSRIRDNLKKSFREGEMADQVWTFWSRKEDGDLR